MYTKAKKTISHVTPQRPMTQEEQKQRIMQFLAEKRETFALAILQGICSNPEIHAKNPVEEAVEMADHLMEKLYPLPKEEKPKEEGGNG